MQLTSPVTIACGWALIAGSAHAQESSVRLRSALYQDDDATTVVTSAVEAEASVAEVVAVRAGYLVDALTTASVDVVAAASERWDERRDELRGGARVTAGDVVVSAGVLRSIENDYDSWTLSAGASVDLAQRATTLALSGAYVMSDVGRADDPAFAAEQGIVTGTARLVQALSPDTLGSVGYTLSRVEGYQASPYRYVRIGDGTAVLERHPSERLRHAITGRLRHSLSETVAVAVDQRFYGDDWGVLATTTSLALAITLSDAVDVELRNRFHYQAAASFWEERYDEQRRYMSADRELSTFFDDYLGPAVIVTTDDAGPFDRVRADLRADLFYYRFLDYAYLEGRIGALVSIGVEGAW